VPESLDLPPLYAGVLVGGKSTRMGRPKQLLEVDDSTFIERIAAVLGTFAREVVLLGAGPVPASCDGLLRLGDPPGLGGPMAGMLAAFCHEPSVAWLFVGCDQPLMDEAAVTWLAGQRAPGTWAVVPSLPGGRVQPLFALYEPRSAELLQGLADMGISAPRRLAEDARVSTPVIPPELARCWQSIDTPDDLATLRAQGRDSIRGS